MIGVSKSPVSDPGFEKCLKHLDEKTHLKVRIAHKIKDRDSVR